MTTTGELTAGWSPQWWRSGVRSPLWWLVGASALGWNLGMFLWDVQRGITPHGLLAWQVLGVTAEILVGLLFWMWRPRNVVGPLLVGWTSMAQVPSFADLLPHSRLAVTVALLSYWVFLGLYVWMLFAFPNGTIWNRWARPVLVLFFVWQLLLYLPASMFVRTGVPTWFGSTEVPSYLYVGHGWSGVHAWEQVWWVVEAVLWVLVDLVLVARLWQATPGARRRLLPLYGLVGPLFTFDLVYHAIHVAQDRPWDAWFPYFWFATFGTSAAGAAFGLSRVRHARSSVSDLVVELGEVEPGGVRDALARTLGDPSLVLGLWLPERGVWADEQGREISVAGDGSRGVTYVGERLAVLVHDRDLLDQPRLLESVGSAARLALENERLQAELRAQLAALRDSRARIVRAGDEERRRLERDLHDGAQQRLLGIGMGLQLLRGHLDQEEESSTLLAETERELGQALAELRELARGIHPAVLTDHGIDAAIRTLADRAPIPVTVEGEAGRLPEHVETAAYFVVAEALANVAKYANATRAGIRLRHDGAVLTLEIDDDGTGGASPNGGTGLRGLADRIGALDGHLTLHSPPGQGTRIRAEIPCRS